MPVLRPRNHGALPVLRPHNYAVAALTSVFALAANFLLVPSLFGFPFSQKQDSGFPGEYLMSFSASGRAAGLAGAYSTFADEPAAFYYNPAALSFVSSSQIGFMHSLLPNNFQFTTLGYALPYGRNTVAVNFVRFASPAAERTSFAGANLGRFRDEQASYFVSFSRRVRPKFGIGGSVKVTTQNLDESSGMGYGLDMGSLLRIGPDTVVGLALQNIGGPRLRLVEEEDTFPMALRGGVSRRLFEDKLILSLDAVAGLPSKRWSLGAEYSPFSMFAFRGGLNQREISFGFGFQMRRISFDYAASLNDLGVTHFFSTGLRFGLLTEEEKKVKKSFLEEKKVFVERLIELKVRHGMELVRQKEIVARLTRAKIFLSGKKYIKARRELKGILKIDPGHKEAISLLELIRPILKRRKR